MRREPIEDDQRIAVIEALTAFKLTDAESIVRALEILDAPEDLLRIARHRAVKSMGDPLWTRTNK